MGYSSFQIGCLIVEYGMFNTTTLIRNLIYIRFGIILTQFYINFSRQEHQICIVQNLRFLSFSLYPLSFFLYRVLLFKFNHVLVHNSTIFEVVFFYFFIQNTYADKKVLKNCEKVCFVKLFSNG